MDEKLNQVIGNYTLQEFLGEGQTAKVYKVFENSNPDKFYCIKMMNKDRIDPSPRLQKYFEGEKAAMEDMNHPNIQKMYECFVSEVSKDKYYCLVTDYCNHGDLGDYIKKNGPIEEQRAVYLMKQIFNGVIQQHAKKIIHRDLKLENILLNKENEDYTAIIGDLGFAKKFDSSSMDTTSVCGTINYMAPEIMNKKGNETYNSKVDLWSIGVIFYRMLFDKDPFDKQNQDDKLTLQRNKSGINLQFPENIQVSEESKKLLQRQLVYNPANRMTVGSVVRGGWTSNIDNDVMEYFKQCGPLLTSSSIRSNAHEKRFQDNLNSISDIKYDNSFIIESDPHHSYIVNDKQDNNGFHRCILFFFHIQKIDLDFLPITNSDPKIFCGLSDDQAKNVTSIVNDKSKLINPFINITVSFIYFAAY